MDGPTRFCPRRPGDGAFVVDGATGLVQPVVRYPLRGCRGRASSGRVALGLVAVWGHSFEVIARHARVRLRLTGRFDSEFQAHGDLRIEVRRCGARRIPRTAQPVVAAIDDDRIADEDLEDGEELELDDVDETGEPIEDEEPPPDDEQP